MTRSPGSLDAAALAAVLVGVCDAMAESISDLTHADQAVGDGDHGLAIQRGTRAARQALLDTPGDGDVGSLFEAFGLAMLTSMGGASGAIYGTLFRRGGARLRGETSFDAQGLATFLDGALAGVRERGGASVGDKTLVDALQPASEAAVSAGSSSLAEALDAAAGAARAGVERTRDLPATLGRARTLGDRAIGHVDPGALSLALLLTAWADAVRRWEPTT